MDTHGDLLHIDMTTDFHRLVFDCLAKVDLNKNPGHFKLHPEQCKSLCNNLIDKLSPHRHPDVFIKTKSTQRAWKEIYRAVKEAETYLKYCSTDNWWMKSIALSNTGEAFALHMHDLAWSVLSLELNIREFDNSYAAVASDRIPGFYKERSDLRLLQFGYKFQDCCNLLIACQRTAAMGWTLNVKQKYKVGVLKSMERKLLGTIKNESTIESATGSTAWFQIPPKDLIPQRKTIGEGSFGEVFEGSWLGLKVAVKDIPIDARDLFDKEAAVLAKLQSPFIVQLIGMCIQRSHCYLVMELVSSSLDKLLKNAADRPPLPLPVAVDMMLQISRGMEYLHSQGIMHMDLKASNVLIEPSAVPEFREQGYGRVKLCDFGMASLRLSSFRCADPKGTCYWRAPEAFPFPQEEFLQEIDTLDEYTYKADVYSFAMTFYEILTGKQPFLGVYPRDLYPMIVQGKRPILQPSSCPLVLANYIHKCWETDPRRRPCFAQVSSFLRNMKLFISRMNDPRDRLAESVHNSSEVSFQLLKLGEEALNENTAAQKMKTIDRILCSVPAATKRQWGINAGRKGPTLAFVDSLNQCELDDFLGAYARRKMLRRGSFRDTLLVDFDDFSVVVKRLRVEAACTGNTTYFERCNIQALGSLKHTNVLSLWAYYNYLEDINKSDEVNLFVYEYLPNGSLDSLLHVNKKPVERGRRMKITKDVAGGLAFLHNSGVAHGNVKSSNILFDNDGNACLADFGLEGLLKPFSLALATTSASYMAPERQDGGSISEESDVYSFGVVLLELLTRKKPNPMDRFWVSSIIQNWAGSVPVFDKQLMGMHRIARHCCFPVATYRPKMSHVVTCINHIEAGERFGFS